ncbi:MAG: phosphate acyltransferase PlsX [Phycisphaera sp.]|nr:phosphate acyltransferase PlsX [Phycisphaera sp.]
MRIGVDVSGGDNAPHEILKGSFEALPHLGEDDVLVLAGDQAAIEEGMAESGISDPRIQPLDCPETIGMDETPVEAVRGKQKSSITRLSRLGGPKAGEDRVDCWISAGNTGACVTAAQMYMRRLRHVHRPGIAVTVPTFSGPIVLIDVGANIEPKPHHLAQYGVMGSIYASRILGVAKPRVGLMNVGGEEAKGTSDMKSARDMLRDAENTNFIGYVEGRGVFDGEADVVVTDGVVGNVMIKLAEGLSAGIFKAIASEVFQIDPELALRFEPVVKSLYAKHDYHEYGGAPLLGVNGGCMIAHGSAVGRTITNAVIRGREFVLSGVNEEISKALADVGQSTRETSAEEVRS